MNGSRQMRRILVTGSRDFSDVGLMRRGLNTAVLFVGGGFPENMVLVHGGCPTGADWMASDMWVSRNGVVEMHAANWDTEGKAAGPIRNQRMVEAGADVCLAFPVGASRGTAHCMKTAMKAGIPTFVFPSSEAGIVTLG